MADEGGAPRDPALTDLFRQEAEAIADRLDVLLGAATAEGVAEARRLVHTLKGLALALGAHPLRDLARGMEAALVGHAADDLGRRATLLSAVDAARALVGGAAGAPAAARRAAEALEAPSPAPSRPGVPWARRALGRRLLRRLLPILAAVDETVAALARGRDDRRTRTALARELEVHAAACGVTGHAGVASLGLALAAALHERTPTPGAAAAAKEALAALHRAAVDGPVDAPLEPQWLTAVEAVWSAIGARPDEDRAAHALELPWPDADRPADVLLAIERLAAGAAILDARPAGPDGRHLRGLIGLGPGRHARREDEGFVRVPRRRLDHLLGLTEQLLGAKSRARGLAKLGAELAASTPAASVGLHRLARHAQELDRELDHLARRTQEAVLKARLVPVRGLYALARVTVAEHLGRHPEKSVDLEVEGSATEVDKAVVDRLVDPLLHLVRNALVHGIEPRERRAARGKPERAKLRLAARAGPAGVILDIEDDGQGLDQRLFGRPGGPASADGIVVLRDEGDEGTALALHGSTTEQVTDDAGRGVGLLSVLERVRALRGRVVLRSVPGKGTLARIVLPPAAATARVLLVRVGPERYALPLTSVVAVEEAAARVQRHDTPCVRLAELVGPPQLGEERRDEPPSGRERRRPARERRQRDRFAVVVTPSVSGAPGSGEGLVVLVDDVLRRDLVVVRPLGRRFAPPGVDGAAIFGDGRLVLVLDPWRLHVGRRGGG